jgi:hypothetical protein
MPPRNFSPTLRRKQMGLNGINVPLDRSVVKSGAAEAMFWCHPCGLAYCLECRVNGLAREHNIINYPSELSSDFMPDSIGSRDSPFDIGVLIDAGFGRISLFWCNQI